MAKKISKETLKKPVWLKYTKEEIKEIILNLIKKTPELTSEKIGLILRDNYGIPKTKLYGIKIGAILKEDNLYKNPETENVSKKIKKLESYLEKNKQDKKAKRSLIIKKARLKKIAEYLKKREKK